MVSPHDMALGANVCDNVDQCISSRSVTLPALSTASGGMGEGPGPRLSLRVRAGLTLRVLVHFLVRETAQERTEREPALLSSPYGLGAC